MAIQTLAQVSQGSTSILASLTPIMFAAGDAVRAKSDMHPFWMTVVSVNERTGFCRCEFGYSGRDAGNFHCNELKFHGGVEINASLAS